MAFVKPSPGTLSGFFAVVAASACAGIISYAIAAWGNTSDSALVSKTKVTAMEADIESLEDDVTATGLKLRSIETHQRYLRQQSEHTEKKVDALLDHFSISSPAEPALPPAIN